MVNEAKSIPVPQDTEVIHIAPVVLHREMSDERADRIQEKLDIRYPYLLFPGNFLHIETTTSTLVSGFALLKEQFQLFRP